MDKDPGAGPWGRRRTGQTNSKYDSETENTRPSVSYQIKGGKEEEAAVAAAAASEWRAWKTIARTVMK